MQEKIEKILTPVNILVGILLLAAFVLRIYRVDQILGFYYDQGRDASVILDLIEKGKMFLIGPTTGIEGIFRGPFYYYLIAPFYWLGRGNPVWPSVFLASTSVLALGIMYLLAKKTGGVWAGVIALILAGFSFEVVYASRWLSNPTPMLLLSMVLIWLMFLAVEGKKWAWAGIMFILGLSLFHFGSSGEVFYFPAIAIFAAWRFFAAKGRFKNIPNLKITIWGVVLFGLTLAPLILFDLKHGGILRQNIGGFLSQGESFSLPSWRFASDRLILVMQYFSQLIFHNIYEKEALILTALGLVSVYHFKDLFKNDYFKIIFILLISPIVGLVFFKGNYGNLYAYYLTGYYLIFLLIVSVIVGRVFQSSPVGKILAGLFLFAFLVPNYNLIRGYINTTGKESDVIILTNQKMAIDWIYNDAGESKFNVDVYVPPVVPHAYDYLFRWYGGKTYGNLPESAQTKLLYTLYEIDPPNPQRLDAWLDRQAGIGRIIKEERFGGITVQRRERINKK